MLSRRPERSERAVGWSNVLGHHILYFISVSRASEPPDGENHQDDQDH